MLRPVPRLVYPGHLPSAYGIGAMLSQVKDGQEKVIAYGSKSLSKEERICVIR